MRSSGFSTHLTSILAYTKTRLTHYGIRLLIFRLLLAVLLISAFVVYQRVPSTEANGAKTDKQQSRDDIPSVLQQAEKSGSLVDATIKLPEPLTTEALEAVVVAGEIQSIEIVSTTTNWKGALYRTADSPITSLAAGLRSYEDVYRNSGPGDSKAVFAVTAFTLRGLAAEISRARESLSTSDFVSVSVASDKVAKKSSSATIQTNSATAKSNEPQAASAPDAPWVPTSADLNIQTLSNLDRRIEVNFSWNSSEALAGLNYENSALEIQVVFLNHADHPLLRDLSYVGPVKMWGTNNTLGNGYLDTLALNRIGLAGDASEHEVTIGSYNARADFQPGRQYTVWAITERGELDGNVAKLSFQRGKLFAGDLECLLCAGVAAYCAAEFALTGKFEPSNCVAGFNTETVTRSNEIDTKFSIVAPTVPPFKHPTQTCLRPPGYPSLPVGLNIPESEARDWGLRIPRIQRAFTINGGTSVVGCPDNFVHKDTAWWPRGGWTQDVDGTPFGKGKGAIMLAPDAPQAFWVHGAIWTRYSSDQFGGPKSVVGEPTSDEKTATSSRGSNGAFQSFTSGYLYFNGALNKTFFVANAIAEKYRSVGLHNDPLGFPISDEYQDGGVARSDFEGGHIEWTANTGAVIVRNPRYEGVIDLMDCNVIRGWAADHDRLNTSINISIYDGSTLITTVPANQLRTDVGSYLGDNGQHGFNIPTPAILKTGTHSVSVRFESSASNLNGSPRSFTCTPDASTPAKYEGFVDLLDCNVIRGWAVDRNRLNTSINVSIYDGSTLVTSIPANQLRSDVGSYLGDNGQHGFNIPTPAGLKTGTHSVSVRFEASTSNLTGSPQPLTCSPDTTTPPKYEGWVDLMDCNVIRGWAVDRNRLNTSINVSIYDGNTLITSIPANQLRSDVGSYLGDNGLHGFNIPTPASLKNDQPHSVSVRFESSTSNLNNSPRSLTCSSGTSTSPKYEGWVDAVGCDVIRGWAADRNRPNTSINVSIYDGSTLVTTIPANQLRSDVGSVLGDNGLHGFNIPTPPSLKNDQPHSVSVRFESSATNLNNSPRSLTCSSGTSTRYEGWVDVVDCNVIRGWAADRNRLNTSINVSIYDGSTLLTTILANQLRTDVGSFLGDNGLHGFNIPTPASLKTGSHSVSVKFESSATNLNNSPKSLTCVTTGPAPQISSISPNPVPTFNANQNVQVSGSNFQAGLIVDVFNSSGGKVGTLSGSQIQSLSSNSFTMVIFLGSSAGSLGIEAVNPDGGRSARFNFSTTTPTPTVNSINPSSPPATNSNQNVGVFGSNFQAGLIVDVFNSSGSKVGTLSGSQILSVTPTSFSMLINLGSTPGSFGIEVLNPSGARSARFPFSTQGTNPSVSSISPNPVPTFNADQNVDVFGSNFQSGLSVDVFNSSGSKVGTLSGSQIKSVTSSSFTMVISLGSSASTFGIEVVNSNGGRSSRFTFSTTTPNPSVSSISPNPVPVFNGNQNVKVFGNNFQSGLTVDVFNSSGVKVGTLSGSQVLSVTPTSFTMVISLGSTPATFGIEVVNPSGRRSARFNFSTQ